MGERDVLGSSPRDSGSLCSPPLDRQLYEAALAGHRNSLTLGRYVQIKDLEWATGQLPLLLEIWPGCLVDRHLGNGGEMYVLPLAHSEAACAQSSGAGSDIFASRDCRSS